MRIIKRIAKIMLTMIVLMFVALTVMSKMDGRVDYNVSTAGVTIPTYTAVDMPFDQSNHFETAHPFAAGAIIDIDSDGVEEVFLGGGPKQLDAIVRYVDGEFVQVDSAAGIEKALAAASFGASVLDTNADGFDDLIVSRTDGVWLHLNQGGTFSPSP